MRVPLSGPVLEGHVFDVKTETLYRGPNKDKVVLRNKIGHYLVKKNGKTVYVTRGQLMQQVREWKEAKAKRQSSVNVEYSKHKILKEYEEGRPLMEICIKYDLAFWELEKMAFEAGLEIRE